MKDIIISEFMDEAAIDRELHDFRIHYDPKLHERPEELARLAAGARALIVRNRTRVDASLIAAADRLEAVGRLGVGLDNIDLDACRASQVAVYPATGANSVAVAEYVISALLTGLRRVFEATEALLEGAWPRDRLMGREIAGRTLGLVGYGAIAREAARRALALGMRVVAYDPNVASDDAAWSLPTGCVERSDLRALLATSDAVSLHIPLTAETKHLIDAQALAGMPPHAGLINTARGGIVDEHALAAALRAGRLGWAALDVFAAEPLDPDARALFAGCPNLILTPHIAGVTVESNTRVSFVTAAAVARHLRSNPARA